MTNYIWINSLCVQIELSFEKFDMNGFFPEKNPTNNQIMLFACLPDVFICNTQYLSCKLICHGYSEYFNQFRDDNGIHIA